LTAPARLRRTYFDCRYGQLHVYQAIPPGGGFDEATPLLCLPGARGSGRFFQALLGPLGADRSIYAPDLPGCGESDAAGAGAGAEQYALACADLLDSLYQRRIDVLAHAEGCATAVALARLRPGTLVNALVFSAASRQCLAQARELGLQFRELALAGATEVALTAQSVSLQLSDLITFFCSNQANSN
jgi:pimeloyl-ACP methyl ester carboxylesterase